MLLPSQMGSALELAAFSALTSRECVAHRQVPETTRSGRRDRDKMRATKSSFSGVIEAFAMHVQVRASLGLRAQKMRAKPQQSDLEQQWYSNEYSRRCEKNQHVIEYVHAFQAAWTKQFVIVAKRLSGFIDGRRCFHQRRLQRGRNGHRPQGEMATVSVIVRIMLSLLLLALSRCNSYSRCCCRHHTVRFTTNTTLTFLNK